MSALRCGAGRVAAVRSLARPPQHLDRSCACLGIGRPWCALLPALDRGWALRTWNACRILNFGAFGPCRAFSGNANPRLTAAPPHDQPQPHARAEGRPSKEVNWWARYACGSRRLAHSEALRLESAGGAYVAAAFVAMYATCRGLAMEIASIDRFIRFAGAAYVATLFVAMCAPGRWGRYGNGSSK